MKHETTYHTVLWKQRRIASGHREGGGAGCTGGHLRTYLRSFKT